MRRSSRRRLVVFAVGALVALVVPLAAGRAARAEVRRQLSAADFAGRSEADVRSKRAAIVDGRVAGFFSHAPIADADVRWSLDGRQHETFTDANGRFRFLAARASRIGRGFAIDATGSVELQVAANRFRLRTLAVPIGIGRTSTVAIALLPKAPREIGTVGGRLTDRETGRPIAHAVVTIVGAGETLRAVTGPLGFFAIPGVGANAGLTIRYETPDPPCIATVERPLVVAGRATPANLAVPVLKLPFVHCPAAAPRPQVTSAPNAPLANDPSVTWQQADVNAIQMNPSFDSWNAGHVNDILKFADVGGGMLAATDTGGVWAITTATQALPLSGSWNGTSMTSLALGPDGTRDVYAATWPNGVSAGGQLWETDTSDGLPALAWRLVQPAPPCGSINRILVLGAARKIVLACDSGVYWSAIPPAPSVHGTYAWVDATPSTVQQGSTFSGLAAGPGWTSGGGLGTIVASKWGGYAPGAAIYTGSWSGGGLHFTSSSVQQATGLLFSQIGRSTVASCAANPSLMFAVAEDGNSNFAGVWKSTNGGSSFSRATSPTNPGAQGSYNQAIAISKDCKIVALGWQSGTFVSYDLGTSWTLLKTSAGHLHGDVHALTFDPNSANTLYIGSDGGVASASGLGNDATPTFRSDWNRQLIDMQIYHADGSSAASGLVSSGLQDNGVIWAGLPGPWQHASDCGCDGRWSRFFTPSGAARGASILTLEEWGEPDFPFGWTAANGNAIPFNQGHSITVGTTSATLGNVLTNMVRSPGGYSNGSGETMYGAGAVGAQVYGMFATGNGSSVIWQPIGKLGGSESITAIAPTYNGGSVFVGTNAGNIYRFDAPYTGNALQLTVDAPAGASGSASVSGIAAIFSSIAFATLNVGGRGYVLTFNGATWEQAAGALPNGTSFTSIVAPDIDDAFVSTGGPVYSTHDGGATWYRASSGLPVVTQGNELRVVADPNGPYLYLATYGRSLWRARLP